MNTRNFLALLCVCGLVALTNTAAADDTSHAVMERWIGQWTGGVAGAAPSHFVATPDHAEVVWTLDGHFLQGTNFDAAGKPVGVWMMHYEPNFNEYLVYFFTANNSVCIWKGVWSEVDTTMTWQGALITTDTTLSGFTKFADDKQTWELDVEQDGKITKSTGSLQKK